MQGLKMLFWSAVYETYNAIVNPVRRWDAECAICGEVKRARSYNGATTKLSLHIHFADDHDDPGDVDWPDPEVARSKGEVKIFKNPDAQEDQ